MAAISRHGRSVPNHLLCDGREVAKASFPELYGYLGDRDVDRATYAAEVALLRHRVANAEHALDLFLELIDAQPEKAKQHATKIKERRDKDRDRLAQEAATIRAAAIKAANERDRRAHQSAGAAFGHGDTSPGAVISINLGFINLLPVPSLWEIAYLKGRKSVIKDLAPSGDNEKGMILSEYTLRSLQEAGNAIVADLS